MSSRYSEGEAVRKPAGELLRKMGWSLVCAYDDERLGRDGILPLGVDRAYGGPDGGRAAVRSRGGFTNERQLTLFDMLYKDFLTKSEVARSNSCSPSLSMWFRSSCHTYRVQ